MSVSRRMRSIILATAVALTATLASAATVQFVTPGDGAQLIGPQVLEIRTDASAVNRVEFVVDGVLAGVVRTAPYRMTFDFGTTLEPREVTARVFANGYRDTFTATIRGAAISAGEVMNVDLVEVPLRIRAGRTIDARDLIVTEN